MLEPESLHSLHRTHLSGIIFTLGVTVVLAAMAAPRSVEAQTNERTVTAADSIGIPEELPDLEEQQRLNDQLRVDELRKIRARHRSAVGDREGRGTLQPDDHVPPIEGLER